MAQTEKTKQPSFYEVVFEGKPKVVRAFLMGLVMGSGLDARIHYSFLAGVRHDSRGKALAEKVGIRATDCHVIVDGATSALLKKLNRKLEKETGLRVTSHRNIRRATMEFRFQTFAPHYHEQITRHFGILPAGLKMADYEHEVSRDPNAKGVETYTAVHEFESTGKGVVSGRIDVLIGFKEKCAEFPLIETEDIELVLA